MSIDMVYTIGQVEFSMPFRDDEVFARIASRYPDAADAVLGVAGPDVSGAEEAQAIISRRELLEAVNTLLVAFKDDPELTPRRYVFDFDIVPGVPVVGDSNVHAVKFAGKELRYQLLGGIDTCILQRAQPSPAGVRIYTAPVDLRDQRVLDTESHGPIRIRSTKKPAPIARDLRRLKKFLESQVGETVIKRVTW